MGGGLQGAHDIKYCECTGHVGMLLSSLKESALKPSNPFVVATGRLPPATPCGPGVLTVCCRSPHACDGQSCDNPYSKTTISTLNGGPTAPLSGCCCRTQRKRCGPHLLHLQQCGAFRLTGEHSYGSTTTLGSQNARGPVALVGPCRERERHVRPPALDLPALQDVSAHTRLMN